MNRHAEQRPRLLEPRIIDGLEKRLSAAQNPAQPLREVYELRALSRRPARRTELSPTWPRQGQ